MSIVKKLAVLVQTETPALNAFVVAVLGLILGLGVHLTTDQTGAIEAVVTAALALIAGIFVRPFGVSLLTGFVSTTGTLLVAFGLHASPGVISAVNAIIVAVFALFARMQVVSAAEYAARKQDKPAATPAGSKTPLAPSGL